MNNKQQAVVENITKGRPDVEFTIGSEGERVTLTGKGKLPWPEIIIGKLGGVVLPKIRSYPDPGQAALEGDILLQKQTTTDARKSGVTHGNESPILENYKFFAFAYLSDWWQGDNRFVNGLRPSNGRPVRLQWLRETARYYQIDRNFKLKYDGLTKSDPKEKYNGLRLGKVLDALDKVGGPITSELVDGSVDSLVKALKNDYQLTATSASSKFLWICQHPCPVVISDKRARTALSRLGAGKLTEHDYAGYRKAWREEFGKRKDAIICACNGLARLVDFAPTTEDGNKLDSVVKTDWFHERVFDTFLWWNRGE